MRIAVLFLLLLVANFVGRLPAAIIAAAVLGWLLRDLEQVLRDVHEERKS